jgi:drug/metabolite transporter (DMT)-like permease
MSASLRMTGADWAVLALLSLLWGGSFLLIEIGLTGFPPVTLVALRMALAVPLMIAYLRWAGDAMPRDAASWLHLSALGFINIALPMALFFWAQTRIESGLASILNATVPLWGVLIAHVLTHDERATWPKIAGVLLGFCGIVVMVGVTALTGLSDGLVAQLACLFATFCFALAPVYSRQRPFAHMSGAVIATGQTITSAVMLLAAAALLERPWAGAVPGANAIGAVLALAFVSTSFAYILFFRLIARAGASNAMLIALIMPVVAVALGASVLGEALTSNQIIGAGLIALGLVAIDGRLFDRLARRRTVP